MKAPKYVIFIDHFAEENSLDRYVELNCSNLLDLFGCLSTSFLDEKIYLFRVYEVVRGSRGREYERLCTVRTPHNLLEVQPCIGLTDTIRRNSLDNYIWFE